MSVFQLRFVQEISAYALTCFIKNQHLHLADFLGKYLGGAIAHVTQIQHVQIPTHTTILADAGAEPPHQQENHSYVFEFHELFLPGSHT